MKAPCFTFTTLLVLASALPLSAADVVGVITGVDLDKKEDPQGEPLPLAVGRKGCRLITRFLIPCFT